MILTCGQKQRSAEVASVGVAGYELAKRALAGPEADQKKSSGEGGAPTAGPGRTMAASDLEPAC